MSGASALLIFLLLASPFHTAIAPADVWEFVSANGAGMQRAEAVFTGEVRGPMCVKLADGLEIEIEWEDTGGYAVYRRPLDMPLDLTGFDRVAFDARGDGALVFVGFEDSDGDRIFYGPHGADMTNTDFVLSRQREFRELDVVLFDTYRRDYPVVVGSERRFDFERVRAVLFQVSAAGEASVVETGPVLGCADMPDVVEPGVVSPNFDGVNDAIRAVLHTARTGSKRLAILAEGGRIAADLGKTYMGWGRNELEIPCAALSSLPDGRYRLVADGADGRTGVEFEIDRANFWDYSTEPEGFSLAAYMAGERSALDGVADDGAYFARAFSQMSSWGLDAVVVLNLPVEDWHEAVEAAQDAGMKIILHLCPLDELILADHRLTEREFLAALEELDLVAGDALDGAFGFYLVDEPPEYAADNLGLAVRILSSLYPAKPVFSTFNRLPRMKRLIDALPQNALFAFDAYPLASGDPVGDFVLGGGGYKSTEPMDYADYAAAVRHMSGGRRFIAAVQAHGWSAVLRQPTVSELSAMSWLAVSEGAESIIFFLYMDAHDFTGLVDRGFKERAGVQAVGELSVLLPRVRAALDPLVPRFRFRLGSDVQATLFSGGGRAALLFVNRDMEHSYALADRLHGDMGCELLLDGSATIAPGGAALVPVVRLRGCGPLPQSSGDGADCRTYKLP